MTKIDALIAQAEAELRRATATKDAAQKDRHVMRSERLLDRAWSLNEADAALPPLESGLWCSRETEQRRAA